MFYKGCLLFISFLIPYVIADDEFKCSELNGNFPNPDNCREYFNCKNGKLTYKKCPPIFVFDPKQRNVHGMLIHQIVLLFQ